MRRDENGEVLCYCCDNLASTQTTTPRNLLIFLCEHCWKLLRRK